MRKELVAQQMLLVNHSYGMQISIVSLYLASCQVVMVAWKVWPLLLLQSPSVLPSCPRTWSPWIGRKFLCFLPPSHLFESDGLYLLAGIDAKHHFILINTYLLSNFLLLTKKGEGLIFYFTQFFWGHDLMTLTRYQNTGLFKFLKNPATPLGHNKRKDCDWF